MTKEEIFNLIIEWEQDAGEDLLDQGFDLKESTFMTWCLGKGYLNRKKYNDWLDDYTENKLEAMDANYFVYNDDGEYGAPYAVVSSNEWNKNDYEKACMILAEFISEIDIYIDRLKKFISQ